MYLRLVGLIVIYGLSGCVYNGHSSNEPLSDIQSIRYTLPYTHAKVTATLTLKSCDTPLKAAASVAIVPVAAPSSVPQEQFVISGPALQSLAKSHDVSVTLHENRSLETVNATTTDKAAVIIGNIIKLGTLFAAPASETSLKCTSHVRALLTHTATLKSKIEKLRKKQYDPDHVDDETVAKQINVLATELARLNTGPLQVKLAKTVAIQPKIKAGYLGWNEHHFRKWIENPNNTVPQKLLKAVPEFKLRYCIWTQGEDEGSCTTTLANNGLKALACRADSVNCPVGIPVFTPKHAGCGTCSDTLVFRDPVIAKFVVVADADNYGREPGTTLAGKSMPINQWGKVTTLPMSVGFGGSKTVSIKLDPFGLRTSFGWKSGASGEAVTGALGTLGEQYAGFRDRDDGASLKEITDEATYLEARQKLNRLESCSEIIENGGYECPSSE